MADRSRDPEALEQRIERTRLELAQTIDELAYRVNPRTVAHRVNPRTVAHRGAERLRDEAGQVAKAVNAMISPARGTDGDKDDDREPRGIDPRLVIAGIGAAVVITALVIRRRRKKRG